MPDEPTSGAGDAGSSSPPFRGGVERADEAPAEPPHRTQPADADEPGPSLTDRLRDTFRPSDDEPPTSTTAPVPSRRAGSPAPAMGADPTPEGDRPRRSANGNGKKGRVRARKVRRIVRHIEPWSVLKISLLFYAALFVIISVASTVLWNAARSAGTVEDVESFITEVGGFGTCEPIDGEGGAAATTTTLPPDDTTPPDQFDPNGTETTVAPGEVPVDPDAELDDDEDCREGEELVGEFRFEDDKIFQAFVLGGIVLVLAGSAMNVVMVLLFNLMSDLTGGVRVTVLEEDAARPAPSGSQRTRPRG
ncbi:MAG: DUF3566 domain-containing protein [Actinomycetota bacterium]